MYTNSLKEFYYIYGIKLQKNVSDVKYTVKNRSIPTLSALIEPALEAGKTTLTVVQKGILDTENKNYIDQEVML